MIKAFIVDIDGTLALRGDRSPYDERSVALDAPNAPIIDIVQRLISTGLQPVFVSGRTESARHATTAWLHRNLHTPIEALFLRETGDNRPDAELKSKIYAENVVGVYDVQFVLDDRSQTVTYWRSVGLTCLQVADGNF